MSSDPLDAIAEAQRTFRTKIQVAAACGVPIPQIIKLVGYPNARWALGHAAIDPFIPR